MECGGLAAAFTYATNDNDSRRRSAKRKEGPQLAPVVDDWCKTEFRVSLATQPRRFCGRLARPMRSAKARKSLAGYVPLTVAYDVATKATCPVLTVRG
jgi:hypothetical protein